MKKLELVVDGLVENLLYLDRDDFSFQYKLYIENDALHFKIKYIDESDFEKIIEATYSKGDNEKVFLESVTQALDEVAKNATLQLPF